MKKETIIRRLRREPLLIDVHTHVGTDPANYVQGDFPYAQSAEDLVVRMDRWGIDVSVCFPFLYTSYFDLSAFLKGRMRKRRTSEAISPYAIENARLCQEIYEAYPMCARRLLPFMFFDPTREPAGQAAAMMDLADRYPVFGLKTAGSYTQSPITDLLKQGECLLDFAAARNLPFMIHTSVKPDDPWANVHAILKVVRARPDIRFCLAHTCRFDRRALEQAAELPNCFVDFSALHIHCDLARTGNLAVAAPPDRFRAPYRRPDGVMAALAKVYPDTMLWGTDSPYYCFMGRFTNDKGETEILQLKCDTDAEIASLKRLSAATRRRIGYTNTLRFLFG